MVKLTRKRADGVVVTMTTSESQAKLFLAQGIWTKEDGNADNEGQVSTSEQSDTQESGEASEEKHQVPRKRGPQKKRKSAKDVIKEMTVEVG